MTASVAASSSGTTEEAHGGHPRVGSVETLMFVSARCWERGAMTTRGGAGHVSGVTSTIDLTARPPVLTWCGAGPGWGAPAAIADHGRIVVSGSHECPLVVSEVAVSCATVVKRAAISLPAGRAHGRTSRGAAGSGFAIGGAA